MGSKFVSTGISWCGLSPSGRKASTLHKGPKKWKMQSHSLWGHIFGRGCNIWLFYCFGLLLGMRKFLVRHKFPVEWMQSMNGSLITKYCVMRYKLKTTEAFHPCVWDVWESQTLLRYPTRTMPTEYFIIPHKFHNGIEINDAPMVNLREALPIIWFHFSQTRSLLCVTDFEVLNKHITIFLNLDNQFLLCQWDLPIVSEGNEKATTLEKLPWSRPALGPGVAGFGGLASRRKNRYVGAGRMVQPTWCGPCFCGIDRIVVLSIRFKKAVVTRFPNQLNSSMVLFIWGYHLYPFHSISTPKN